MLASQTTWNGAQYIILHLVVIRHAHLMIMKLAIAILPLKKLLMVVTMALRLVGILPMVMDLLFLLLYLQTL